VYDPEPGILSMEAIADSPACHRARAAVRFDEISRAVVHALKYGYRLDLAQMLGRWIAHAGRRASGQSRHARSGTDALASVVVRRFPSIDQAGGRGLG
jgi:predicted amidophosphoribosyltransferase